MKKQKEKKLASLLTVVVVLLLLLSIWMRVVTFTCGFSLCAQQSNQHQAVASTNDDDEDDDTVACLSLAELEEKVKSFFPLFFIAFSTVDSVS
jgi:hypothetical protein